MLAPAAASALPEVWRGGMTRCLTQGNLLRAPPNTDRFSVAEPEKFSCQAAARATFGEIGFHESIQNLPGMRFRAREGAARARLRPFAGCMTEGRNLANSCDAHCVRTSCLAEPRTTPSAMSRAAPVCCTQRPPRRTRNLTSQYHSQHQNIEFLLPTAVPLGPRIGTVLAGQ